VLPPCSQRQIIRCLRWIGNSLKEAQMSIWKALCLRQDHYFGSISGLKDKSVKLATRERCEVSVALTSQLADLLNWITASD
jgi:hypothetical protein